MNIRNWPLRNWPLLAVAVTLNCALDAQIISDGFEYDDGSLLAEVWDGRAAFTGSGDAADQTALRIENQALRIDWGTAVAEPLTSDKHSAQRFYGDAFAPGEETVLYTAFDLTVTEAPTATDQGRPTFYLHKDGAADRGRIGIQGGGEGDSFQLGVSTNPGFYSAFDFSDINLSLNQTYRIGLAYDVDSTTTTLWVDASSANVTPFVQQIGSPGDARTPNRGVFQAESAGLSAEEHYGAMLIDDFQFGTDAAIIPEPSTYVLLSGAGALVLVLLRRSPRKRIA